MNIAARHFKHTEDETGFRCHRSLGRFNEKETLSTGKHLVRRFSLPGPRGPMFQANVMGRGCSIDGI